MHIMQIPNWRPRSQLRGNSKGLKMIILIMITDLEDTEALGTTEFLGKGFLLVYNSNYGPPMHSTARIHERDQPTANQPMTSRRGLSRYAPLTTVRCIKITICNTFVLNKLMTTTTSVLDLFRGVSVSHFSFYENLGYHFIENCENYRAKLHSSTVCWVHPKYGNKYAFPDLCTNSINSLITASILHQSVISRSC